MKAIIHLLLLVFLVTIPAGYAAAQDLSGRWRGRWTSAATPEHGAHAGPLRVRLVPKADGSYRGLFVGRFAVVIPYVYRATVSPQGDAFVSTRRLGPLGEYRMRLVASPGQLNGGWSAAGESGTIRLDRR